MKKRKLLLSVVLVVMAVAVVSTSTFAWFAMTSEPTVENFDMNVTTDEGLWITAIAPTAGTDGTKFDVGDFKYSITMAEIATQIGATSADSNISDVLKLNAVTPNGSDASAFTTTPDFKKLGLDGNFVTDSFATKNEDYLAFDVYFLSKTARKVSINQNTTATTTTADEAKVLSPIDIAENLVDANTGDSQLDGTAITKGTTLVDGAASNAVRVGAKGDTFKIFEPNHDKGWTTYTTKNMAEEYFKAQTGVTTVATGDLTVANNKETSYGEDTQFLTLQEVTDDTLGLQNYFGADVTTYYGVATIYVWLEGADADCFDAVLADVLNIGLSFHSVG